MKIKETIIFIVIWLSISLIAIKGVFTLREYIHDKVDRAFGLKK